MERLFSPWKRAGLGLPASTLEFRIKRLGIDEFSFLEEAMILILSGVAVLQLGSRQVQS